MKLFITCPSFARHGGIRVILEWANRFAARGHDVVLRTDDERGCSDWFDLDGRVEIVRDDSALDSSDCVIVTSPHGVDYLRGRGPERRFAFMQMAEHFFRPADRAWVWRCTRFYRTPHPLILISRWNEDLVRRAGRRGPVHYVGNGVNLDHFPVVDRPKDGRAILVEGWWPTNPTKDVDRIGARVATRLRDEGYRILAYTQRAPTHDSWRRIPHELVVAPSLAQLNRLYESATILLKATRLDARSCAPMEAMTKGTVTVRAIERGDDDLVHGDNALRCTYDEEALYAAAKQLLTDGALRRRLADNGREYVQTRTWDHWMDRIEGIVCGAEVTCGA